MSTTKVILVSSGIDSYIGSRLLPDHETAYVDLDTRYAKQEWERLTGLYQPSVALIPGPPMSDIEQDTGFIPQRNLLLVTLAQAWFNADEVVLCAVAGEYSRDKHERFFKMSSKLLSYTAGKKVTVHSPFIGLTKRQLVNLWLDRFEGEQWRAEIRDLHRTYSCYGGRPTQCGDCPSCFRRWVAFESADVPEDYCAWPKKPWATIIKNRQPVQDLRGLPMSQAWPFLRAQADVVLAYAKLIRRVGWLQFQSDLATVRS